MVYFSAKRCVLQFSLILSLSIFLTIATNAMAASHWEANVINGNPYFRTGAGTSFPVIQVLTKGSIVNVVSTAQVNGYINIQFNGSDGYVWNSYLDMYEVIDEEEGQEDPQWLADVINGNPYLREGPGSNFTVIKVLVKGSTVEVIDPTPNNGYIQVKDGADEGFTWAGYLNIYEKEEDGNPDDPPVGGEGFSFPTGDPLTGPVAGPGDPYGNDGWRVIQVMGHYWHATNPNGTTKWEGRHLAQDIRLQAPGAWPADGLATIDQPVRSVANGKVKYAGRVAGGTYHDVVMIEHNLGDEDGDGQDDYVCSFYGHLHNLSVNTGDTVQRADKIGEIVDWKIADSSGFSDSGNTHLHYVIISKDFCDYSTQQFINYRRTRMCGYDAGGPWNVYTLTQEPDEYDPLGAKCETNQFPNAVFYSPSKFIQDRLVQAP